MKNYEELYNSALERARKLEENSNGMILKKWLFNVFPELAESEDEKIRKAIICGMYALKEQHRRYFASIHIDDVITWLEKQEDKSQDEDKIIPDKNETRYIEQNSADENERIRKAISQCVEDMRGQFEKLYNVHHKDAIDWLEKQCDHGI